MDARIPDLALIRRMHRTIDPYHTMIYFTPEATRRYEALGLDQATGYFASRSAALGAVPNAVIAATFFNFSPNLIAERMQDVWTRTTPTAVLAARLEAADNALHHALGSEIITSQAMKSAASLAREAASAAVSALDGRPLFAAHSALAWPDAAHLVLWHAVTLLREFRGDVHISALVTAGLDGLDALVLHAASGSIPLSFLQATRGWSDQEWDATVALHRDAGLIEPESTELVAMSLSGTGERLREEIEVATDRGCVRPWAAIGSERCEELRSMVRPWSRTISDTIFASLGSE